MAILATNSCRDIKYVRSTMLSAAARSATFRDKNLPPAESEDRISYCALDSSIALRAEGFDSVTSAGQPLNRSAGLLRMRSWWSRSVFGIHRRHSATLL